MVIQVHSIGKRTASYGTHTHTHTHEAKHSYLHPIALCRSVTLYLANSRTHMLHASYCTRAPIGNSYAPAPTTREITAVSLNTRKYLENSLPRYRPAFSRLNCVQGDLAARWTIAFVMIQ